MGNNKAEILRMIGQPDGRAQMVVRMHNTNDIIKQMQAAHYDNSEFARKIAYQFKGATIRQTCKNIFNWIKNNIDYRIEPATMQTTKTLQRLVSDGYGDCKHYSGFFAAILTALGIKHNYRFASYSSNNSTPTHVYVVAYDENNKPIICDAVLSNFNTEKPYKSKIDKFMLMQLSGIGAQKKGRVKEAFKKVVQAPKKAVQAIKKAQPIRTAAKATGKAVTKAAQKVKKAVAKIPAGAKTIGIAPARAAFLALVGLNVRGFANKLQKANQTELKKKWNNLGGNFTTLQNTIRVGSSRKAVLSGFEDNEISGIGVVGVTTVAASLATAAPIIVALTSFLKENPQVMEQVKAAFEKQTGQKVDQTPFASEPDFGVQPGEANNTGTSSDVAEVKQQPTDMSTGINKNTLLLIGGVGVAAFLLMRKK
jgi:hypothetical protein